MKIYEKVVIDIESGNILEEESYDYNGPTAQLQTTTTTSTTTFTTTTPPGNAYGICADQSFGGYMTNLDLPTWSEARDSTSTVSLSTFPADPSARIIVARHYVFKGSDRYTCARFFVRFDLSEFPVGVNITDIRLGLPVPGGKPFMDGKFVVQEGPTSFTAEDYNGYTGPEFGHSVLTTSNVDGYNYVYLNLAGRTFVENNIGGYVYFCLRDYTYDYPDVEPVLDYDYVWSNTSDQPYINLEIYYEPATVPCTWLSNYEYVITDRGKPGTTHDLRSVAYGDGRYVAVGLGGKIITSTDGGETWVQLSSPTSVDLFVVRYLNCVWYVGGRAVIYTSPDGLTWTYRVNPANTGGRLVTGFAYDGEGMVVAASWSHTVEERSSYSTDGGITWTVLPNGCPDMFNFTDLIYAEGMFVGCGGFSTFQSRFTYSYDGLNWSAASIWGSDPNVRSLAHNGSRFFAVGFPGRAWISDDGINWTRTSQEEGAPRLDFDDACYGVTWNGCQFVIAGLQTNWSVYPRIITTLDGYQPFTYEFVGTSLQGGFFGIAFDGIERHVCVGDDGQIITADIHSLTTTTTASTTLPPLPTTTTTCPPSLTDDDFNDGVIAPWWTLRDKQGGEFEESGGYMNILSGPGGCDAINPCTPTYIAQCITDEPYDYWIKVLTPTLTFNGQEYGMMSRDLASEDIYAKTGVKRSGGTIYVYALYSGTGTLNEQTIPLPLGIPEVWFRMTRDSSGVFWFYYALSQPHSIADWTLFDSVSGVFDQDGRHRVGLFATNPFPGTTSTTITTTSSTVSTTIAPAPTTTTTGTTVSTTTITSTTNWGLWTPDCTGTPGYHDGLQVSQSIYVPEGPWKYDSIDVGDMISSSGYAKVMVYYNPSIAGVPTSGSFVAQTGVEPIGVGLEPYTFTFDFPNPIVFLAGYYSLVVTATDIAGNIASGETVTLYASPEHYAGGRMWYYNEGGPGWVEDSSSDALCIMLRGILFWTPGCPDYATGCSGCPEFYNVAVSGLGDTCDTYDCGPLNTTWYLQRSGPDICEWSDSGTPNYTMMITLATSGSYQYWLLWLQRGATTCAAWTATCKGGSTCPPTGGYPRWRWQPIIGGDRCSQGSITVSIGP